jgi:hypothetical protein
MPLTDQHRIQQFPDAFLVVDGQHASHQVDPFGPPPAAESGV